MTTKIIISLIIIFCSFLIGTIYANAFIERTKLLGSIMMTIQMLETEIVYSATPLPLLLKKVAGKSGPEIGAVLESAAESLNKKEGKSFNYIWQEAVFKKTENISLKKEDIELLLSMGNYLGISNSEDQVKYFRLAMEELKQNYRLSIEEQNKNVRLYKNLSLLLGIAIVIILF